MRRYDGNTGRYIYVPDHQPQRQRQPAPEPPPPPKKNTPPPKGFGSGIEKFLSGIFSQGFEVEDLLLFAVLFLMYQESGDKELLIIMGGMFLL